MEYINFNKIDKGYRIKSTGQVVTKEQLSSGQFGKLRNRPGIDEFEHLGYIYTEKMGKGKTIHETETDVVIELDVTTEEADNIIDKEKKLKPKKLKKEEIEILIPPIDPESGVT